jgi:hypothetical protein
VNPPDYERVAWLTEEWIGDEKPYRKRRAHIEKIFTRSQSAATRAAEYAKLRADVVRDSRNPEFVYSWIYAIFRQGLIKSPPTNADAVDAQEVLRYIESPATREFARARFLLITGEGATTSDLKIVGRRLYDSDPSDLYVSYNLPQVLHMKEPDERRVAKEIANTLKRSFPSDLGVRLLVASIYFRCWLVLDDRAHAQRAIAEYHKYLQMDRSADAHTVEGIKWQIERMAVTR